MSIVWMNQSALSLEHPRRRRGSMSGERNGSMDRKGKRGRRRSASLSAGIEISHDDVEHLTGESGLALGNRRVGAQFAIGVGQIPVLSRHGRQASAAATNESRAFRRGDARLKGPVGHAL